MKPLFTSGIKIPNPGERALSVDEQRIMHFLEHGIIASQFKIQESVKGGFFGDAADAQTVGMCLQTLSDAIRAGLHDEGHPMRIIDPEEQAWRYFATGTLLQMFKESGWK